METKKIVVINGSPRSESNTMILVRKFLTGYTHDHKDAQIREYPLRKLAITPCSGNYHCWHETPGKCVFRDKMDEIIPAVQEADLVVWASPLYNGGFSSLIKTVIERTLPLKFPQIIKKEIGGRTVYTNPSREGTPFFEKNHVLITSGGFPEQNAFDSLRKLWGDMNPYHEGRVITCVMGELLKTPLRGRFRAYLDDVEKAGRELIQEGAFSSQTRKNLLQPLIPVEEFLELSNQYLADKSGEAVSEGGVKEMMKLMEAGFKTALLPQEKKILEIRLRDPEAVFHFVLEGGRSDLREGASPEAPQGIIESTVQNWKLIMAGNQSRTEALNKGLYTIRGELNFLEWVRDKMYHHGGEPEKSPGEHKAAKKEKKVSMGRLYLDILPWITVFSVSNYSVRWGLLGALVLSTVLLLINQYRQTVTRLEMISPLIFLAGFLALQNYTPQGIGLAGVFYVIFALVWAASLLTPLSFTAEYSSNSVSPSSRKTKLFARTNRIITLVWALNYAFVGLGKLAFLYFDNYEAALLLDFFILATLVFTQFFARLYPQREAVKGRIT